MRAIATLWRDPRHYQIAALSSLAIWGTFALQFPITPARIAAVFGAAIATQWIGTRISGIGSFEVRSAMISSLSLLILLRSMSIYALAGAAVLSIGSKFVLRTSRRHLFNPTAFGIVVGSIVFGGTWIAPGQWGTATWFCFFILCIGSVVSTRASRADISFGFLGFYAAILIGRALWLGDPLAIPLRELSSGALLVFAFFMISDPRTTPETRTGRLVFAGLVATAAGFIRFYFFRPEGAILALVVLAPLTLVIDRILPGIPYRWPQLRPGLIPLRQHRGGATMKVKHVAMVIVMTLAWTLPAFGFCGFYVARADTTLYNRASQVAIVHDGDRTVLTMANDFQGEPEEFAIVIPVPTVLEEGQIHVADMALLDHLDAYTSPRLVEYFDEDPCRIRYRVQEMMTMDAAAPAPGKSLGRVERDGVTIEASYTVGEYDILILSAAESDGLQRWLTRNGYRIPAGAERILQSYIRQGLKFFVAKVNLEEQSKLGFNYLRPLQVAYESRRFMLPIRLGTVNADGDQELFIYVLTRNGRVETTNYRTVRLPSDVELPPWIKNEFGDFYRAMFTRQVEEERKRAVFLEYAWDMGWCDPCAADPLSNDELRRLGVFWIDRRQPSSGGQNVFVTRLHVRYDAEHFPDDLMFKETGDRTNFQARYVLRHPWEGDSECDAARAYRARLRDRQEQEARALHDLTGWKMSKIRREVGLDEPAPKLKWWESIWGFVVAFRIAL